MIQQYRRDLTGTAEADGGYSMAAMTGLKPAAAYDYDKPLIRAVLTKVVARMVAALLVGARDDRIINFLPLNM